MLFLCKRNTWKYNTGSQLNPTLCENTPLQAVIIIEPLSPDVISYMLQQVSHALWISAKVDEVQ